MANDINQCSFTGNLVRDAELKYTNQSLAICNFSIAVNKKFKDKEYTSFFSFTIFGKFAEAVSQYLVKGLPIAVGAEAKQETWEQDGKNRSAIKFTVNSLRMFGNKGNGGGNSGNQGYNQNQGQQSGGNQGGFKSNNSAMDDFEDDIPF
ncbi:single-stranded DNA-binding protein [Candidatus Pacearchaeota archaeon]|nr:single-stranded DNA-binding protein [Candidatus Pacearchaeota archaeon]